MQNYWRVSLLPLISCANVVFFFHVIIIHHSHLHFRNFNFFSDPRFLAGAHITPLGTNYLKFDGVCLSSNLCVTKSLNLWALER